MQKHTPRPRGVTTIAVINSIGAFLTVAFWGFVFVRVFAVEVPPPGLDRGSLSTTFGFMIGDLTWASVLLIVSVIGLRRMRDWGWLAAQMVNILWLYSMTVIWCRDIHYDSISPGAVLFSPFIPCSVWAMRYLWNSREQFGLRSAVRQVVKN